MPGTTIGRTEVEVAEVDVLKGKLNALINAIEAHPLLTSDPAKNAPRALYFTWDFIRRTEYNLDQINVPALLTSDKVALEAYNDCLGRISLFKLIIGDSTCCREFTQNEPVDFGPGVRARAADLLSD